jgi:hypothetical protein
VRYDGVDYREVHDDEGPTGPNFMTNWREANGNPTLGTSLAMLRELTRSLGRTWRSRRMNHDSPRGNSLPIPLFRHPLYNGNIRTFESRDAWQTLARLALNFHRRKEWTFAAIGASLSPCRDKDHGDGGEDDANFRREIGAMMTVQRGLKLRRVFTSRPTRLALSPLHAISATRRHSSAPSRNGT